jgi:hypothetical protein
MNSHSRYTLSPYWLEITCVYGVLQFHQHLTSASFLEAQHERSLLEQNNCLLFFFFSILKNVKFQIILCKKQNQKRLELFF